MPQAATQNTATDSSLTIPEDVAAKFPKLIEMVKASRSMDDEERQYWVDVLPIMSEEQIQNLRTILLNEQRQIKASEATYAKEMGQAAKEAESAFDEAAYLERKRAREEAERLHEQEEREREKALLEELSNL